jgi:hypothetical protein
MPKLKQTKILPIDQSIIEPATTGTTDMSNKRQELEKFIQEQRGILAGCPAAIRSIPQVEKTIRDLNTLLDNATQKPRAVVIGTFNATKSSFINELLGHHPKFPAGRVLPEDFTPSTNGAFIVKHSTNEYPDGTVRIVYERKGSGKDRSLVGGPDLLEKCTHAGSISGFKAVEVYLTVPLLECFDFIDTPGLESGHEEDDIVAENMADEGDIIIFLSCADKFGNGPELTLLTTTINALELRNDDNSNYLDNLFFVASKWDTISNNPNEDESKREKLFADLEKRFKKTYEDIDFKKLRNRFFSFACESRSKRKDLADNIRNELVTLTGEKHPQMIMNSLAEKLNSSKKKVQDLVHAEIKMIEGNIKDAKTREKSISSMEAGLANFKKKKASYAEDMNELLAEIKESEIPDFIENLTDKFSETKLLKIIRQKWDDDKDEAKEALPAYILNQINRDTKKFTDAQGIKIKKIVNATINDIQKKYGEDYSKSNSWTVDVRELMIEALSESKEMGGLSFWAADLPKGYILVNAMGAKAGTVGGVLGAGGAMAALLGAPLVLIGLGILAVGAAWFAFGQSWQASLAQKAAGQIETRTAGKIERNLKKFIDDTEAAYEKCITLLESRLKKALQELKKANSNFDPAKESKRKTDLDAEKSWPLGA